MVASGPLTTLIQNMARYGAFFSGGYLALGSAAFALAQRDAASPLDMLLATAGVMSWAAVWALLRGTARQAITPVIPMILIVGILGFPTGITWPPIATLTFASALVAVCMWPPRVALLSILFSALATCWGTLDPTPTTWLISTDFLGGLATTLVALTLPTSILIVTTLGRAAADRADHEARQTLDSVAESLREEAATRAQADATRAIHETLLNTLVALADRDVDPELARGMCRSNLESLHPTQPRGDTSVKGLVNEVFARHGVTARVPLELETQVLPSPQHGAALRSALNEVLVNVERHAGGQASASVNASAERVHVWVHDTGDGDPATWTANLGITVNVHDALSAVGGNASFLPRVDGGVSVHLEVPLHASARALPTLPAWSVLVDRPLMRLALIPTVLTGIVFVPVAAQSLALPAPTVAAFAAFMLAELVLAFARSMRASVRSGLAVLVVGLGISTLAIASSGGPTCASSVPMHWVIYSLAGGALLPVLTLRRLSAQTAIYLVWISATVVAAFQWPADCLSQPLGASVENIVWSTVALGLFLLVRHRFRREQRAVLETWQTRAASEAQARYDLLQLEHLAFAAEIARPLLGRIISGDTAPGSERCRHEARSTNGLMRAYLSLTRGSLDTDGVRHLRSTIRDLHRGGWEINLTLGQEATPPQDMAIILMLLERLGPMESSGPVSLIRTDQGIYVSCPRAVAGCLQGRTGPLPRVHALDSEDPTRAVLEITSAQ